MLAMTEKRKVKVQKITTMKAFEGFQKVVAELAKLRGTSVPVELDKHRHVYEDELLSELAKRKEAIERSRLD